MTDLVGFVSSTFPNERIVVKPHPLDPNRYDSTWSNVQVVKDVNTHLLAKNSKCVVGINSTVLMESTLYDKPVAAMGKGIFTGKGILLEAHTNPEDVRGITTYRPDRNSRDNFLYDLLFNYQVKIGDVNERNIVEKHDVDMDGLRRWAETNLLAQGTANQPCSGHMLDYYILRSYARRIFERLVRK